MAGCPRAAARGSGRSAGAAARGQSLRHRPAVRDRPAAAAAAVRARPRVRRRGDGGRRRGHERARRRPRDRAVPDLVRRVRALPARSHRQLRGGAVSLRLRLAAAGARVGRGALRPDPRAVRRRHAARRRRASVPPWALAAAADNATDGWRCVAPHLAARPGATVLVVTGIAPSIALYAADAALALGASRVDVLSPNPEVLAGRGAHRRAPDRVEFRRQARSVRDHRRRLGRPGRARRSRSARPTTRASASARSTISATSTPVPLGRMYTKGVHFHAGRCHARHEIPAVAAAIAAGRLHGDVIATRRVGWQDAAAAMAEPAVKLVVER